MSYILDALRRANAEREQGAVPGLHTQQYGLLPDDDRTRAPRPLLGAVVVLALALAGALTWNFLGREAAPPRPLPQGPVTASPSPVIEPGAAPLPAASPAGLAATPPLEHVATDEPAASASLPARRASRKTLASAPAAPLAPEPRASSGDRIYRQADLPETVRRELPKLAFGGASYSRDAASRMVILNGQVFHEGDTIAPGLVLREIRLKEALLSYKSYRFELGY